MSDLRHTPLLEPASCSDAFEGELNLYMDGELSFGEQPRLFAHLAICDQCRGMLGMMMEFRRMSRQEMLTVPVAVDDTFYRRLDKVKRNAKRVDRVAARRPLWYVRAPVSLRSATMAALALFFAGLMFPRNAGDPIRDGLTSLDFGLVEGLEERVEFQEQVRYWKEAIYVFYPGLTVEASRLDDASVSEAF